MFISLQNLLELDAPTIVALFIIILALITLIIVNRGKGEERQLREKPKFIRQFIDLIKRQKTNLNKCYSGYGYIFYKGQNDLIKKIYDSVSS